MKKVFVVLSVFIILTFIFFYPRLFEMIVRMQRSDSPESFGIEEFIEGSTVIKLAEVELGNQIVEFYYDDGLLENEGLYYTLKGKNQKITEYNQSLIEDESHKYKFYANFYDKREILVDGVIQEPIDIIYLKNDNFNIEVSIYYLDKAKEIKMKERTLSDYQINCLSEFCTISSLNQNDFSEVIESWEKTEGSAILEGYEKTKLFSVDNNWYTYDPISGSLGTVGFSVYLYSGNEDDYYLSMRNDTYKITADQLIEFKNLLNR